MPQTEGPSLTHPLPLACASTHCHHRDLEAEPGTSELAGGSRAGEARQCCRGRGRLAPQEDPREGTHGPAPGGAWTHAEKRRPAPLLAVCSPRVLHRVIKPSY